MVSKAANVLLKGRIQPHSYSVLPQMEAIEKRVFQKHLK